MIPAPDPALLPPGPYVLVEDPGTHTMLITTLRDWGDGRGPQPLLGSGLAVWKQRRRGAPRGTRAIWAGFEPVDVAVAHHLLALLNHHHECTS